MRYWLPLVAALVLLIVAGKVASNLIAALLVLLAFGLVIEVSTKLFENAGKTGGVHNHRQ